MDFKALFLGYAIGDAFGAGVEFQDRQWIRQNVDFTKLVNARDTIVADVADPQELIPYCLAQIMGIDEETSKLLQAIEQIPPPHLITEDHYKF